jgi:hypothetical protein
LFESVDKKIKKIVPLLQGEGAGDPAIERDPGTRF